MPTRQAIVANAQRAARKPSGGTAAPPRTAGGPSTGLGQNRPVYNPQIGLGAAKPAPLGAPATGAGGAPPGGAPTPWSSQKEAAIGNANRNYLGANANLDFAEQGVNQDFGLAPGFNDYKANPNSRAALLEEKFKEGNRGTMNSAGLQLYSGSTGNRLAQNRRANELNRDQLGKSYRDSLQEISDKRLEAAERKGNEETEAGWDAVRAAEEAPLDSTQAPLPKKKKQGGAQRRAGAAVGGAKALSSKKGRK